MYSQKYSSPENQDNTKSRGESIKEAGFLMDKIVMSINFPTQEEREIHPRLALRNRDLFLNKIDRVAQLAKDAVALIDSNGGAESGDPLISQTGLGWLAKCQDGASRFRLENMTHEELVGDQEKQREWIDFLQKLYDTLFELEDKFDKFRA